MKKDPFNTNKKSNKDYALLNGLIVDIDNSKFIKGTVLIKSRLIEDFGSHIKNSEISKKCEFFWFKQRQEKTYVVTLRAKVFSGSKTGFSCSSGIKI